MKKSVKFWLKLFKSMNLPKLPWIRGERSLELVHPYLRTFMGNIAKRHFPSMSFSSRDVVSLNVLLRHSDDSLAEGQPFRLRMVLPLYFTLQGISTNYSWSNSAGR
jgi:hypothetical protein